MLMDKRKVSKMKKNDVKNCGTDAEKYEKK